MTNTPAHRLATALATLFEPPSRLSPSEWCARYIRLPAGANETEPGRIDWSTRPYLREPLDRLTDPKATDIIFVAPTRDGKTFLLRMGLAYSIGGDPCPCLWYDSTEAKGRSISIKEIQPLVEHNDILSRRKPRNRNHYTNQLMMFAGAPFLIYGANTAGQAAGDTAKFIFGNEVDKWGEATDKEAGLLELVRHRTESFDSERCHMFSSTPTLETGPIWYSYLKSDQRVWLARCPDCGKFHALKWDNVRWAPEAQITEHQWNLDQVKTSAYYQCEHCGSRWSDHMRRLAVQHPEAHWNANNPSPTPGFFGYHINGLYGPKDKNNVGNLAVDFLSARVAGFYANRQDFWNSRMGMPWVDNVSSLTQEKFAARECSALRGEVPTDMQADVLIIGADVQTYGIPWVAEVCDWSGRYHTIDHGIAATWADLEQVQRTLGENTNARGYVIIDANFEDRRTETLQAINGRQDLGWVAAEGFEYAKELVRVEKANVYMGGRLQSSQVCVPKLMISTYEFKVELEKAISGEMRNWTTYQLPLVASPAEQREQEEFYAQLLDERRVPRKRRLAGKPAFEWKSRSNNNHAWDCKVYARAMYYYLSRSRQAARQIITRKPSTARKTVVVK